MDITRLETGYDVLDTVCNGGIPKSAVVAYLGHSEPIKQKAGLNFISQGLKNNENCLIINTNLTIEQISSIGKQYGYNIDNALFLDAAGWRVRRVKPKYHSPSSYQVDNLTDLNALLATTIQINKDLNGGLNRIYFETPSNLLLYTTPGKEQVYKFFELLTAFTRNNGITMVYSLEIDIHDAQQIATLLFLSDGAINFRNNGNVEDEFKINFLLYTLFNPTWHKLPTS